MTAETYFDDVASRWDEMRSGFYSEGVRDTALAAAGVAPGMTAADIGGGTGFITETLVDRGLKVIAVDQSQAMLDEMRKKFGHSAGVDYRLGEASSLPLQDGALDCAFANMYLTTCRSPRRP